jgi:hypothetical protein
MPTPSPARPDVTPSWRSRLKLRPGAWPGLLTLLSVLAVLMGQQPPLLDQGTRVTAGSVAPALPDVRPAPQPTPGPALLTGTPPEPFRVACVPGAAYAPARRWTAPSLPRTLALLGRRQTDGG